MELDTRIQNAAEYLFSLEHHRFAAKLGLCEDSGELLHYGAEVIELVFSIDELAWSESPENRRLGIQLIALCWEHGSPELRGDLREFFVISLSRLGVPPSTQMIDPSYKEAGTYAALNSFRGELATLTLQLPLQRRIGSVIYQLTDFQRRAFDLIERSKLTGISAPTSAGKSFAIYLAIVLSATRSDKSAVYIVPTISLVNQVSEDLRGLFDKHGLNGWTVANSFKANSPQTVFVLTQERAILAIDLGLAQEKLSLLVVDEVQNLERVSAEDEHRAKILFDFLHDMRYAETTEKIILSGPRLENVGSVGSAIFNTVSAEEQTLESPVASITYSVERIADASYVLNQYRDALNSKATIKITNTEVIKGIGTSVYNDEYYSYLAFLVQSLGDQSKNLLFAPTADQARKIAAQLPGLTSKPGDSGDLLLGLSQHLEQVIHPSHRLVDLVKRGVAFHTGGLPPHARLVVEQAFSDGLLKDVVCTTTLMQGVNLPADVVFIRSPNLYVRKPSQDRGAELSAYEFANLRGRAGRLLRDFVGRTVVLDESSFTSDPQAGLFKDTYKSLNLTYGEIFQRNRDEVLNELSTPGAASSDGSKFIATFIRQTTLRHEDGMSRLQNVGIVLSDSTLQAVKSSVSKLTIRRDVLMANRYWDPFDLEKIQLGLEVRGDSLPNTVWEPGIADALVRLLEFQAALSPTYFQRLIGSAPTKPFLIYLALSAVSWAREVPLRKIIEERNFTERLEEQIDNQVDIIYRKVIYGLPAILRPIASIQGVGAGFLASLESGAYHPITQYLISLGMYRETAVFVRRQFLSGIKGSDPNLTALVAERMPQILAGSDSWTKRQVQATLGRKIRGTANG